MTVINRPDWRGFLAGAALPLLGAMFLYTAMLATGVGLKSPAFYHLPFEPTGRLSAAIWIALFGFYGITRWAALRHGERARTAIHLVEALMAWAVIYTFIAGTLSDFWFDVLNVASLCFGIFVAFRLVRLSRFVAAWLFPTFLWKVFAVAISLGPVVGISFF
ncbi:tryptophan-rich sensory protein [Flaviflagellibacter deserti]|jgi:tryptophan-rich sensory protein|uniref:Tryptophan-rich sensory protein n=1 Tax=Flaviflagellibacter deserti TaxID=2267266 RepID=A0ABV9Z0P7_9HYPH